MNSFTTSVVIGVVAIFAATSAQGTCGCAPQPTVIQLSCGGGQGNNGPRQPLPPPPPPAFTTGPPPMEYTTSANMDLNEFENMCDFNEDGYPISHPPGGFPEGFHIIMDPSGRPHPVASAEYPVPPQDWDGRMETLGFPMPQPGTAHYNMLMCTPIPVVTG